MSKILVTPINPKFPPKEYTGELYTQYHDGEKYYYIAGKSFPAEIVTVLEGESEVKTA